MAALTIALCAVTSAWKYVCSVLVLWPGAAGLPRNIVPFVRPSVNGAPNNVQSIPKHIVNVVQIHAVCVPMNAARWHIEVRLFKPLIFN
jgi:hypothetical protein